MDTPPVGGGTAFLWPLGRASFRASALGGPAGATYLDSTFPRVTHSESLLLGGPAECGPCLPVAAAGSERRAGPAVSQQLTKSLARVQL